MTINKIFTLPNLSKTVLATTFATAITGWTYLGYQRGTMHYNYYVEKYDLPYSDMCKLRYGLAGVFIYYLPLTFPVVVSKEIMRADIRVRMMEYEKRGEYYNRIL